jgi:hypothetical protein
VLRVRSAAMDPDAVSTPHRFSGNERLRANPRRGMMESWGCPWFPFVLELLRESAAKSPSPLTNLGVALFCCPYLPDICPTAFLAHWKSRSDLCFGSLIRTYVVQRHDICPDLRGEFQEAQHQNLRRGDTGGLRWPGSIARVSQPQVTAIGQSDPRPLTPHVQRSDSRQRFGVNPPGFVRVGDDRSFLAWGLRHQPTICRPIRVLVARARSESSMGPGR